jgi:hypothetical protein
MQAKCPVILGCGLWTREERDDFRARATPLGFSTVLNASPEPSRAGRPVRIAARAQGFAVTEADMAAWEALYERPGLASRR